MLKRPHRIFYTTFDFTTQKESPAAKPSNDMKMSFTKMSRLEEIKYIFFWKVLQQVKGGKINADKHFVNNQILLLHLFLTNLDDSNLQK